LDLHTSHSCEMLATTLGALGTTATEGPEPEDVAAAAAAFLI
jgi:hypothetical protein